MHHLLNHRSLIHERLEKIQLGPHCIHVDVCDVDDVELLNDVIDDVWDDGVRLLLGFWRMRLNPLKIGDNRFHSLCFVSLIYHLVALPPASTPLYSRSI